MRDASYEDVQNILHECKALAAGRVAGILYSTQTTYWLAYISLGDVRAIGDTPMEAAINLKAKLEAVAYRERYQSDLLARTLGLEAAQ